MKFVSRPAVNTQGPAGTPGSVWFVDSGVPSDGLGINGDFYLNTANGNVYHKVAGTWGSPVDNLTGPQGIQGIQGIQGDTGDTGARGPAGTLSAHYTFEDETSAPPSTGSIRIDAGATHIFVHETDRFGADLAALLDRVMAGTIIQVFKLADESVFAFYGVSAVSDAGAYRDFTVTLLGGNGGLTDADQIVFGFAVRGPQGIQGIQGIQGDQGDPGTNGTNGSDGDTPLRAAGSITRSRRSGALEALAQGQCRLAYVGTTSIQLNRHRGRFLPVKVDGVWRSVEIPASGPTLANTGLTAATRYYIYAQVTASVLTLEASTTAYTADAETGVMIKTGDATRTLVGLVFMGAGTPGIFLAQGLGTLSWFNRQNVKVENKSTTYGSVAGSFPAGAEVSASFRQHYLAWAEDLVRAYINASAGPNGASDNVIALARDTSVLEQSYIGTGAVIFAPISLVSYIQGDETDHYITIFAGSSGTVYVNGNQTANQGTTATVAVVVKG